MAADDVYAIRETQFASGLPCFYVYRPGKPLSRNNRVSVCFPTRKGAERCRAVLIADDQHRAAVKP